MGVSWRQFCLARLAVDIKLIVSIDMLVLGYISTKYERKRNAESIMRVRSLPLRVKSLQTWCKS